MLNAGSLAILIIGFFLGWRERGRHEATRTAKGRR